MKREDYEGKLEASAREMRRLKELNMKYFTRLTVEKEEAHVEEREPIEETVEPLSYDDLLKDWR